MNFSSESSLDPDQLQSALKTLLQQVKVQFDKTKTWYMCNLKVLLYLINLVRFNNCLSHFWIKVEALGLPNLQQRQILCKRFGPKYYIYLKFIYSCTSFADSCKCLAIPEAGRQIRGSRLL